MRVSPPVRRTPQLTPLPALIIIRVLKNAHTMRRAGAHSFVTVSHVHAPPLAAAHSRALQPAIHLLLESAAACCVCLIVTLITYVLDYAGNWFVLHITPPVIVRRCSRPPSRPSVGD
jgi:hypothetical protein